MLLAVVPMVFALFSWLALAISWGRTTLGAKVATTIVAFTLLAAANHVVAMNLSHDLYGGDAENGKVANGHYFVENRGKYTEVSKRFFEGSLLYKDISGYVFAVSLICTVVALVIRSRQVKTGNFSFDLVSILRLMLGEDALMKRSFCAACGSELKTGTDRCPKCGVLTGTSKVR
jgi:hypothetical protein